MLKYNLYAWLNRYDPYWYSRLMGFKTLYITVVLFICNMLLHPPIPSLVMLIAGAGILIIEMPSINTLNKKDNVYLGYVVIICITIGLFSSYVYLKELFVLVSAVWCYLLYSLASRKISLLPIPSILLMLGLMSLEGINSGDFFIIISLILHILEFSMIVFWAHKLFPNLYHKIWISASLRNLESLASLLETKQIINAQIAFKHYLSAKNTFYLLKSKPYLRQAVRITHYINLYQYYLVDLLLNKNISQEDADLIKADLYQLFLAISANKIVYVKQTGSVSNSFLACHYLYFVKLVHNWNKLCSIDSN